MLTADELMRARVAEQQADESVLWDNWYFTSTGIATCAKDDSRCKIVRRCSDFFCLRTRGTKRIIRKPAVIIDYDAVEGVELRTQDLRLGCVRLEENDIVEHLFWQRMLQPDDLPFSDENKATLAQYARMAFECEERQGWEGYRGGMRVFLNTGGKKDCLRAFAIGTRMPHSLTDCSAEDLDIYAYSVRVCPR